MNDYFNLVPAGTDNTNSNSTACTKNSVSSEIGSYASSSFTSPSSPTSSLAPVTSLSSIGNIGKAPGTASNVTTTHSLLDSIGGYVQQTTEDPWYPGRNDDPWFSATSLAFAEEPRSPQNWPDTAIGDSRLWLQDAKRRRLTNPARLSCTVAGCQKKDLKNKSDLQKHLNQHTKPFRCTEVGCERSDKGFGTLNDLERHRASVHGLQPRSGTTVGYVCYVCSQHSASEKWWPRKDNFKSHVRRKHPEWNFEDVIFRSTRDTDFTDTGAETRIAAISGEEGGRQASSASDAGQSGAGKACTPTGLPSREFCSTPSGSETSQGSIRSTKRRRTNQDGSSSREPVFPCPDYEGDTRNHRCTTKFDTISDLIRHLGGALHSWFPCWTCFQDDFETSLQRNRHRKHDGCRPMCLNPTCHDFERAPSSGQTSCFCSSTAWEQWIKLFKMRFPISEPPAYAIAAAEQERNMSQASRPRRQPVTLRRDRLSLPPVPRFPTIDTISADRQRTEDPPASGDNGLGTGILTANSQVRPVEQAENESGVTFDASLGETACAESSPPSQSAAQWSSARSTLSTQATSSFGTIPLPKHELATIQRQVTQMQCSLQRLTTPNADNMEDDESPLEILLGLVWQQLIDANVPAAYPGSALYKQVRLTAPRVVSEASYPCFPGLDETLFGGPSLVQDQSLSQRNTSNATAPP